MEVFTARCLMCGESYQISSDHKEYKKLVEQEKNVSFICDLCNHRIRYEADEQHKEKKPM